MQKPSADLGNDLRVLRVRPTATLAELYSAVGGDRLRGVSPSPHLLEWLAAQRLRMRVGGEDAQGHNGWSRLHFTAYSRRPHGDLATARALVLDHGVDPNRTDSEGWSVLWWAVAWLRENGTS